MTDIKHLEEELRNLEKQKIEVEQRLRQIERKEKETDGKFAICNMDLIAKSEINNL